MERIAVIGCGMAGLAAARSLALCGCPPVVIAPARNVPARGETLSQAGARWLAALGWSDLLQGDAVVAGEGRFSIWGDDLLRRATEASGGFHLDRALLEARMGASLAAQGVERIGLTAEALEHLPNGVRVDLADGRSIEAAAVIDCTGRAALSCGPAADRRRLDRLVAVYRVLELIGDIEVLAATLVEAVADGWWYVAPMPGRRMMLGLFTDSDLLPAGTARAGPTFAALAGKATAVAARLESLGVAEAVGAAPPDSAPAASILASRLVEERILRAGDAAAAFDPLCANGLATALWSGIQAAEASVAMLAGETAKARNYERDYLEGIAQQLAAQRSIYGSERRFAGAPFWARRNRPASR